MALEKGVDEQYWSRRSSMMYYKYIDVLVKAFAYQAESIIDIGSANTRYIESFDWIPHKFTLDIKNPYRSPNVTAIETDFLTYAPEQKFDFVICLQVLEHIPQVEEFARKLFTLAERVLISVPYMWPKGSDPTHIHDPVDEEKIKQWTNREPSYSIIVEEPLRIPSKGISRRLLCYYGPEENIDYIQANRNVQLLKSNEDDEITYVQQQIDESQQTQQNMIDHLHQIKANQKVFHQILKLELEIFKLEERLKDKVVSKEKFQLRISKLKKEIERYKKAVQQEVRQQQRYAKEYNHIIESTSWKMMAPLRSVGSLVRRTIKKNVRK